MSAEPGNIFEARFPNQLDALARVTEKAVQFLEDRAVAPQPLYLANLAIEEMATNILKYGYSDTAPHEILLRLELIHGMIVLLLEDDGHEFNPLAAPDPEIDLPLEQRVPGGLGIHLVRRLIPDIAYQRSEGRNRLTFRIPTAS